MLPNIWVQDNCNGDLGIVLSFGFKVAKTTKSAATLYPMPSDVSYEYGMPGTIVFKCKTLGKRARYIVECSTYGGQTWTMCGVSTKGRQIIAQGLVRGKEYLFRIYGQNEAGNGMPWTSGSILAAV
ncbi:MAG: fibronectin type III domain-containing protein [Saprospiraceae bacterium]|nr:fibronectin type III domain-containing protein [Saprospiraceae bacterium]